MMKGSDIYFWLMLGVGDVYCNFFYVICLLFIKRLKGSYINDVRCLVWYVN